MVQRTGKIVNKRELAEFFAVSPQAIDGWLSRGCPYLEKGAPLIGYKFDTAAVAEWRSEQRVAEAIGERKPDDPEDAQNRKVSAEASLAELKLARELGQLVTLDDVERVWNGMVAACRSRLLAVPSKCATLVFAAETVDEARALIESALHEGLNELESAEGTEDSPLGEMGTPAPGQENARHASAATEADGERVGGPEPKAQRRVKRGAGTVDNGER